MLMSEKPGDAGAHTERVGCICKGKHTRVPRYYAGSYIQVLIPGDVNARVGGELVCY